MQFSTDRAPQRKRDFAHLISGDGLAGSPSEFDASYQEYMKQKRKSTTEMCDLSFDDDFSDRVMRGVEALRKLSGSNSQAFYVINAASYFFPIICASPGLVELTGYSMHEIIGQNCGFLCGQQTSIIEREKLNNALQSGQDASTTMLNYRRNGSTWWNELNLINLHTTSHDGTTAPDIIVGLHTEYSGEGSPSPLSAVTPSITPAFIPSAFCGGSEQDDDTSVLREILTNAQAESKEVCTPTVLAGHLSKEQQQQKHQASPIIFPASTNPDGVSGIKREEASGIKREEAFKSPARPFPVRYGVDSIGKQSPLQQTQQQPTPPQPQQQQQQQQLGVLSNSGAFEFDLDMDMELSLLMDSTDE
ncbi:hypothetical protein B484DRAFT_404770 [Ochromonadaceae sp. CCMP2298]|nr:hypothetical protein B484DRAFT_404770 [Ochromonadaceae sp. CCMP2298]